MGNVTVGGNLAATTDANSGVIDMGTLRVDGTVALTTDGDGDATVVNDTLLDFANSTVRGNLVATATTGNIIDTGVLTISGTSTFTTSQSNDDITLGSVNVLTGAVTLNTSGSTGHAVVDNGTTALDIAASSVGGDLTLTSGHASGITDSGNVTVAGNLIATTDANSGVIDMGTLRVDGTVALTTDGDGDATVVNDTLLDFANSTVRGNLVATATTGNIIDTGVLTISGTSTFTTSQSNDDITLGSVNVLTGAVTLNTSGSTGHAVVDNGTTALDIAASSVGGDLTLTSGHASGITDSGNVTVGGNLAATTDANSGVIDMGTLRVDGTVALTTDGDGDATVVNDTLLDFANSTVRGNLVATATTGNIIDTGVLTISGTSTFTTSQSNDDITLGSVNVLTGAVNFKHKRIYWTCSCR